MFEGRIQLQKPPDSARPPSMTKPLLFAFACCPLSAAAQIPAFPGAEGYGAQATGGRGGDVYIVTNLNSSGAGSLYNGLTTIPASGRTIVFAVSGQIHLADSIKTRITGNKLTIAGQTAPGDGILLKDGTLRISGDDIVIRHLRFRHGKSGSGGDCIDLDSVCQDAILDHVSLAFSTDENISSYNSPPENVTMQWSLNAWGLESHSCGGLWDQNHASCHHSLWAHNHTRNPKARPGGLLEWTNNIVFDWDIGFIMGDSETPAAWKANVIANYFICPPGNIRNTPLEKASLDRNGVPNFSIHVANNLHDRDGDGILDGTDRGWSIVSGSAYHATTNPTGNYHRLDTPATGSGALAIEAPLLAYKKVVSHAGAMRLDHAYAGSPRDEVDARLIQNVVNLTRNHITRESDLAGVSNGGFGTFAASGAPLDSDQDGMPDAYESALGWNPALKDHNTALVGATFFPAGTPSGYTRLEEYLHFKSVPHLVLMKGTSTSPDIDLSRYTAGFANSPVFTLSGVSGGSATQSGSGGKMVHFTANNTIGRGGFLFTVTDADGGSWSQQFAVCVAGSGLPSDLEWRGSGADWNTSSSHWLKGGSATTFVHGDRVTFNSNGAAAPTVNLVSPVTTATVDVDSPTGFTFTGAGGISSAGLLTKRGTGSLTIANTADNSFPGVLLEEGTLAVNKATGLGSATVTCAGGTLSLGPEHNSAMSNAFMFQRETTVTPTTQHTQAGSWTGTGQTVNFSGGSLMMTVSGSWSNFNGRLKFGNGSSKIRLNGNSNTNFGSTSVAIDLGSNNAQFMNRNGATIHIGSLEATGADTRLVGTQTGTVASTYSVGALGTDCTFAGGIVDGSGITHIVKTGSGTWNLTGASTHTGTTTVGAGTLLVNGSTGASPLTVSSGATLGGAGIMGSSVAVDGGGILAPGAAAGEPGALTTGGLEVSGGTLRMDLGSEITGANDKVVVAWGTSSLTGAVKFGINRLDDTLEAGSYPLIGGASTLSVSSFAPTITGLPGMTRQTFSIQHGTSPGFVNLQVAGDPGDLLWTGANGAVWDLNTTTGNWTGATPDTFRNLDLVTFADGAASSTINLNASVEPALVTIDNAAQAFNLTGAGSIAGDARLLKRGAGSFTIGNTAANTFSGGTTIEAGTLVLGNSSGLLGSGGIAMSGGTLQLPNAPVSLNNSLVLSGSVSILTPYSGAINIANSASSTITSVGNATLNLQGLGGILSINGDMTGFSGVMALGTSSGMIRLNPFNLGPDATYGSASTLFDLGTGAGKLVNRNGGFQFEIGGLTGGPGTLLGGRQTGSGETESIYRIGALNSSTSFAGTISNGGDVTGVRIVKTGTGNLTLSGTSAFTGSVGVESGALTVTGSTSVTGGIQIDGGATLSVLGGVMGAEVTTVAGSLEGHGTLASDLNCTGLLTGRGFSSATAGTLNVAGSAFFDGTSVVRMRGGNGSDLVAVSGDLTLAGTVQVALAPGSTFGRYPLFTCGGAVSMAGATLTGIPGGTAAHLSANAAGSVDLVIDDSDEDGLPDSWEMQYLGDLTAGPGSDSDGDGQDNATEYLAGTHPASGASRFAAVVESAGETSFSLVWPSVPGRLYRIQQSTSLAGEWTLLEEVPAAPAPAAHTSRTIAGSGSRRFYRVTIQP
jgi:autotransporter-associated beta strand protein